MLTLYGKKQSRAARCLWVAEEMGLPYEQRPINTQNGETRSPAYLALTPAGKVPLLDDGGFVLRESLAIALYLAAKAPTPLWPDDARSRALILQWSSWAVTDMESPLNVVFQEKKRAAAAGGEPDAGFVAAQLQLAGKALQVLEDHLATSRHVVGDSFSLGDINAYTSVMLAPMFVDTAGYPGIRQWLANCAARPAWQRVQALA